MVEVLLVRGNYYRFRRLYNLTLCDLYLTHFLTFNDHFEVAVVSEQVPQQISILNWLKGTIPPGKKVNLNQKVRSKIASLHYSDGTVAVATEDH